jgi:hypothetical protein
LEFAVDASDTAGLAALSFNSVEVATFVLMCGAFCLCERGLEGAVMFRAPFNCQEFAFPKGIFGVVCCHDGLVKGEGVGIDEFGFFHLATNEAGADFSAALFLYY